MRTKTKLTIVCVLGVVAALTLVFWWWGLQRAELPREYFVLARAHEFSWADGEPASPEREAFRKLLGREDAGRLFARLFERASTSGRLFALCGLYYTDAGAFREGVSEMRELPEKMFFGGVDPIPVSTFVEIGEAFVVRLDFHEQTIDEWAHARNLSDDDFFGPDIAGGGLPALLAFGSENTTWADDDPLERLQGRGYAQILDLVKDPPFGHRFTELKALETLEPDDTRWLAERLLDDEGNVRGYLVEVLEQRKECAAIAAPVIGELLSHESAAVRETALGLLHKFGHGAGAALPALKRLAAPFRTAKERPEHLWGVCGALAAIGGDGVPTLAALLNALHPDVRAAAVSSLGQVMASLPDRVVARLGELIMEDDCGLRETALHALIALGPESQPALPSLEHLLGEMLRLLDESSHLPCQPAYQDNPRDPSSLIALAVEALATTGATTHEHVSLIRRLLKHADSCSQFKVSRVLWKLEGDPTPLTKQLIEEAQHDDPCTDVFLLGIEGLLEELCVASDDSLSRVCAWARDRSASERTRAVRVLSELRRIAPARKNRCIYTLKQIVDDDESEELRGLAMTAICRLGGDCGPAMKIALRDLRSDDDDLHSAALGKLGSLGPAARSAIPEILAAIRDGKSSRVRASLNALNYIGQNADGVVEACVDGLATEHDAATRNAGAQCLGTIAGQLRPAERSYALSALRRLRADPEADVRVAAAWAIQRIENPPAAE